MSVTTNNAEQSLPETPNQNSNGDAKSLHESKALSELYNKSEFICFPGPTLSEPDTISCIYETTRASASGGGMETFDVTQTTSTREFCEKQNIFSFGQNIVFKNKKDFEYFKKTTSKIYANHRSLYPSITLKELMSRSEETAKKVRLRHYDDTFGKGCISNERIARKEFVIYSAMGEFLDNNKEKILEPESIGIGSNDGELRKILVNGKHFRCVSYYFNYVLGNDFDKLIKIINPNSRSNVAEPNFAIAFFWISDQKFLWPVLQATCDIPVGLPLVFQYADVETSNYLYHTKNFSIIQSNAKLMSRSDFTFKVMQCHIVCGNEKRPGLNTFQWDAFVERYYNNNIIFSYYNESNRTLYYIKREELTPMLRKKGQHSMESMVLKHGISFDNLKKMITTLDICIGHEFSKFPIDKNKPLWSLKVKDNKLTAKPSMLIAEDIWPKFVEKMQNLGILNFVKYLKMSAENKETGKDEIFYGLYFREGDLLCVLEKLGCLKDIIALDCISPSKGDSKESVELDSKDRVEGRLTQGIEGDSKKHMSVSSNESVAVDSKKSMEVLNGSMVNVSSTENREENLNPPILHALAADQQKSKMQTRKFNRSAGLGEYANRF